MPCSDEELLYPSSPARAPGSGAEEVTTKDLGLWGDKLKDILRRARGLQPCGGAHCLVAATDDQLEVCVVTGLWFVF